VHLSGQGNIIRQESVKSIVILLCALVFFCPPELLKALDWPVNQFTFLKTSNKLRGRQFICSQYMAIGCSGTHLFNQGLQVQPSAVLQWPEKHVTVEWRRGRNTTILAASLGQAWAKVSPRSRDFNPCCSDNILKNRHPVFPTRQGGLSLSAEKKILYPK